MSYALLILEQPGSRLTHQPQPLSVRPFLEGLATLSKMPLYYANYFDGPSFEQALQYLLDARHLDGVDGLILYVAGHGSGARLGGEFGRAMNLSGFFERLKRYGHKKIDGLILDSCELGINDDALCDGVKAVGLSWAVAYTARMEWLSSMSVNLRLLQHLCRIDPDELNDRDELLTAIQLALELFNPEHVVEFLDDDEEDGDEEGGEGDGDGDGDEADPEDEEDAFELDASDTEAADEESDDEIMEVDLDEIEFEEVEDSVFYLRDALRIAIRHRAGKGRYRTRLLTTEECWLQLEEEEETEEGEA